MSNFSAEQFVSAATVTLATPLPPGESINVRFLLGLQQTGTFKFFINVEALADEAGGEALGPAGRLKSAAETAPRQPAEPVRRR